MNTKPILSAQFALTGALALVTHTAFAQTWQTVDDFQSSAGQSAGAHCVTTDPSGNVFVGGVALFPGPLLRAVVEKSGDGGATWSTADIFTPPEGGDNYSGIASDSSGNLYAVGYWYIGNYWFVRQSSDGGTTWNTVDVLGPGANAHGVACDSAGNVFVVGSVAGTTVTNKNGSTTTPTIWVVHKGTNGGTSWSTVDAFSPSGIGDAYAVSCHPIQGVFVTGQSGSGKRGATVWTTRRSLDGGATWVNVDTALGGTGRAIGSDAPGNIYAAGASGSYWVVRKNSNGGASWTTVDTFVGTYGSAIPYCFAADSNGNLFVVGDADTKTAIHWIVRMNPGGTGSWRTVDDFQFVSGQNATAWGVAADRAGQVFVAGGGIDGTGKGHWIVRKLQ